MKLKSKSRPAMENNVADVNNVATGDIYLLPETVARPGVFASLMAASNGKAKYSINFSTSHGPSYSADTFFLDLTLVETVGVSQDGTKHNIRLWMPSSPKTFEGHPVYNNRLDRFCDSIVLEANIMEGRR